VRENEGICPPPHTLHTCSSSRSPAIDRDTKNILFLGSTDFFPPCHQARQSKERLLSLQLYRQSPLLLQDPRGLTFRATADACVASCKFAPGAPTFVVLGGTCGCDTPRPAPTKAIFASWQHERIGYRGPSDSRWYSRWLHDARAAWAGGAGLLR